MTGKELFPIVKGATEALPQIDSANGGVLSDVWHGLIGDRVAAWRLKNAAELNEKLGKELSERGQTINLDKIPERFAFSWFDKATQEDEPEVQELFAMLLANAAEGNEEALNRRNIELLSRMSPDDAKLLELLAKDQLGKLQVVGREYPWSLSESTFYSLLRTHKFDKIMSVDVLTSIGILELEVSYSLDADHLSGVLESHGLLIENAGWATGSGLRDERTMHFTSIGRSFVKAIFPAPPNSE